MIKTTYVGLKYAAGLLGIDEDALLIAASEGRVRLYWLLNRAVSAEYGHYGELTMPDQDGLPYFWVREDVRNHQHFMYVPLDSMEAAELLKSKTITAEGSALSDQDINGSWWIPRTGWIIEGGGVAEEDLRVTKEIVFVKSVDVKSILEGNETSLEEVVQQQPKPHQRVHFSEKLAKMNQAAVKFWEFSDPHDRGTHPHNSTVAAWFEKNSFSPTLADKAATIIRPEWAPTGRKPD